MFVASFAVTYTANLAELAAKNWTAEPHEADISTALDEINDQQYTAELQPALVFQTVCTAK
jgi:hypothetical protein